MNGITSFFFNWGFRSLNCLNRAPVKKNELQWSESLPDPPDEIVTNILSFSQDMLTIRHGQNWQDIKANFKRFLPTLRGGTQINPNSSLSV